MLSTGKLICGKKSQGAFEYILLLGGVLLIVVVSIIILRGSVLNQANKQVAGNVNAWQSVSCIPTFYSSGYNVRGLWRFDGDYKDSSGKGNNGAAVGTVPFVDGKHGKAISLPGGTGTYVMVNDDPALILPSTGYTIESWVYRPTSGTYANEILSRRQPACNNINYQLWIADPIVNFVSGGLTVLGSAPGLNQWAHLAVVYNGAALSYYLNGQLQGAPISFGYYSSGTYSGLTIGDDGIGCGSPNTALYIDDVVLYDRALSQQEIQQDMNCVG